MNPNGSYALWVIMMCLCRFIDHNKCTSSVGDTDNGRAVHVRGLELYGNSLYILLNVSVNLKLLSKIKLKKKKTHLSDSWSLEALKKIMQCVVILGPS